MPCTKVDVWTKREDIKILQFAIVSPESQFYKQTCSARELVQPRNLPFWAVYFTTIRRIERIKTEVSRTFNTSALTPRTLGPPSQTIAYSR